MSIPDEKRKAISIALIMYQSARATDEIFLQFIGLVIVLEILFSIDDGDIKKKIASRTSALYHNDESKRVELNAKLKEIYKDRSELIHGNTISLHLKLL